MGQRLNIEIIEATFMRIRKLRTSSAAHPQMREIAIPMLEKFKELIPVVFDDIECN